MSNPEMVERARAHGLATYINWHEAMAAFATLEVERATAGLRDRAERAEAERDEATGLLKRLRECVYFEDPNTGKFNERHYRAADDVDIFFAGAATLSAAPATSETPPGQTSLERREEPGVAAPKSPRATSGVGAHAAPLTSQPPARSTHCDGWGVPEAHAPAAEAWVPRVGDVVRDSGAEWVVTKVARDHLRGCRPGCSSSYGSDLWSGSAWWPNLRYVRPATPAEMRAAGLAPQAVPGAEGLRDAERAFLLALARVFAEEPRGVCAGTPEADKAVADNEALRDAARILASRDGGRAGQ